MISAPILLLLGLTGPFEGEGDMVAQAAPPARPAVFAPGAAPIVQKARKRVRTVRRAQRNDLTETLRAMNMMNIGMEPPAQRTGVNQ